jgi:hypothetical protein
MPVPVLLNVCNESCSNKIGLLTTLFTSYQHVNGVQRAGEIDFYISLPHGSISLNMEMPISLIILPLNATTGIALIAI